jgi:hypothetical protein
MKYGELISSLKRIYNEIGRSQGISIVLHEDDRNEATMKALPKTQDST